MHGGRVFRRSSSGETERECVCVYSSTCVWFHRVHVCFLSLSLAGWLATFARTVGVFFFLLRQRRVLFFSPHSVSVMNRVVSSSVFLGALVLSLLGCHTAAADDHVMSLDLQSFDETIEKFPYVLVEFYAPWCGHCKALAPEYEKAAAVLRDASPPVILAKVDATTEEELASKYKVRGFPTLKLFKHGTVREYGGGRTEATIVSWVKKKTGPATKTLLTSTDVESFRTTADVVVVGFLGDGSSALEEFQKAADNFDNIPFGVAPAELAVEFGAIDGAIRLFRTFDSGDITFSDDDLSRIASWVEAKSLPLVVPFTPETASKIFGGKMKLHFLVFTMGVLTQDEKIQKAMEESAARLEGKLLFVSVGPDQERIMEFFDITKADLPTARLVNMGTGTTAMRKYLFTGNVQSSSDYDSFYNDFVNGAIKPVLKSQPVPVPNDGNVKIIVGENFDDVVLGSQDALVEFYAPWCGHCKRLSPVWDELGEAMAGVNSLVIGKMDATANEHEQVDVSGFPTIKFYTVGSSEPIDYDGPRTFEGFIEFLKMHSSTPDEVANAIAGRKDEL